MALFRAFVVLFLIMLLPDTSLGQEQRYLNRYMVRAYELLMADPDRAKKGYHESGWFTRALDYGGEKGAISSSKEAPKTMCNAAVVETMLEAINLYARENSSRGWSPQSVIPTRDWNKVQWSLLKPHLFAHNYMDYKPLNTVPSKTMPASLRSEIDDFHSLQGMPKALEKFGLGQIVGFASARPGDVITFDRDLVNNEGKKRYSGHSVIFLAFLTRDQQETLRYNSKTVVGFKYFSAQSSEPSGLSERWAYFKGMCPFVPNNPVPTEAEKSYCPDAVSSPEHEKRFGRLKTGPRDCCVKRDDEQDGIRVGRVLMPKRWTYTARQAAVAKWDQGLTARVKEFLENGERASERLKLIAAGAVALEKTNPKLVGPYLQRVQDKEGVDLRAIARLRENPEVSARTVNRVSKITPRPIIVAANQQVTTAVRDDLQRRVEQNTTAKVEQLRSNTDVGVPNARLDGRSTD